MSGPDDPVTGWLAERAVPLATTEPGGDGDDLAPLRAVFSGRRVVGLGEATHGTREFFTVKHRLIEFMVTELGTRVVAMEASESAATAVDAYLVHGVGTAERALAGLGFWTWATVEVRDLLRGLRERNRTAGPDDPVRFVGVDPQQPATAVDAVAPLVTDTATANALADLRTRHLGGPPADPSLVGAVDRLAADLADLADLADHPERATSLGHLRRSARLAVAPRRRSSPDSAFAVRDRLMAEAVLALATLPSRGGPVALWAHNGHLGTGTAGHPSTGDHLRAALGPEYYALALLGGQGSFRALHRRLPVGRRRLRAVRLGPPPTRTAEARLAAACPADHVVHVGAPEPTDRWRGRPGRTRSFGAVAPALPDRAATPFVPGVDADGLAFVHHVTPSVPIPQEAP